MRHQGLSPYSICPDAACDKAATKIKMKRRAGPEAHWSMHQPCCVFPHQPHPAKSERMSMWADQQRACACSSANAAPLLHAHGESDGAHRWGMDVPARARKCFYHTRGTKAARTGEEIEAETGLPPPLRPPRLGPPTPPGQPLALFLVCLGFAFYCRGPAPLYSNYQPAAGWLLLGVGR